MGGIGSGRFYYDSKKVTVEESLILDGYETLPVIIAKAQGWYHMRTGKISWNRYGKELASMDYHLIDNFLQVAHSINRQERAEYTIELATTLQPNGGIRHWFVCPVIGCSGRSAKLYLPGGAGFFGCRKCHDLTYRSCQNSRKFYTQLRKLEIDFY